jgi:hypothetical protein
MNRLSEYGTVTIHLPAADIRMTDFECIVIALRGSTAGSGAYPDGTSTRWPDPAFKAHHGADARAVPYANGEDQAGAAVVWVITRT